MSFHPTLGRFLERDPMEYKDSMNPYEYVKSNPLKYVDPMGMESATTQPAGPTTQPARSSASNDLVLRLRDLQARKDYDWNVNGGKEGPNGAWLWKEVNKVKEQLRQTPTIFAYVERPIRADDCGAKVGNALAAHVFVATVPPPWRKGQVIGYGITNTKAKQGEKSAQPEIYQPGEAYKIQLTYRASDRGYYATDDEIVERIKNHAMDHDYTTALYDCRHWASEALMHAGLARMWPGTLTEAEWAAKAK